MIKPRNRVQAWLMLALAAAVAAWTLFLLGGFWATLGAMFSTWCGGVAVSELFGLWTSGQRQQGY